MLKRTQAAWALAVVLGAWVGPPGQAQTASGQMSAGQASSSPFAGRWHWNKAQSTLPPGEPAPADLALVIARADALHVQWSITVTDPAGKSNVESFDAPANGELYPVGTDTAAALTLSPGVLQATFIGPGTLKDAISCALSRNAATLTCNGQVTGGDGRAYRYVDVFDRS